VLNKLAVGSFLEKWLLVASVSDFGSELRYNTLGINLPRGDVGVCVRLQCALQWKSACVDEIVMSNIFGRRLSVCFLYSTGCNYSHN